MKDFNAVVHTDGTSWFSDIEEGKTVQLTKIDVPYTDRENNHGELRVYFDVETWDVSEDGLIYSDSLFKKELRAALNAAGFDASDVHYSEAGMQGDDYVSFDISTKFITSWLASN
jgi:hypothetical protein